MKSKANEIELELERFIGSEIVYQIPILKTRFTAGIKYLMQVAECFWLVLDSSTIGKSLMDKSRFICIDYSKCSKKENENSGHAALIEYTDGNGNILETNKYNFTDFPLDQIRLYFIDGTLMLTSEY